MIDQVYEQMGAENEPSSGKTGYENVNEADIWALVETFLTTVWYGTNMNAKKDFPNLINKLNLRHHRKFGRNFIDKTGSKPENENSEEKYIENRVKQQCIEFLVNNKQEEYKREDLENADLNWIKEECERWKSALTTQEMVELAEKQWETEMCKRSVYTPKEESLVATSSETQLMHNPWLTEYKRKNAEQPPKKVESHAAECVPSPVQSDAETPSMENENPGCSTQNDEHYESSVGINPNIKQMNTPAAFKGPPPNFGQKQGLTKTAESNEIAKKAAFKGPPAKNPGMLQPPPSTTAKQDTQENKVKHKREVIELSDTEMDGNTEKEGKEGAESPTPISCYQSPRDYNLGSYKVDEHGNAVLREKDDQNGSSGSLEEENETIENQDEGSQEEEKIINNEEEGMGNSVAEEEENSGNEGTDSNVEEESDISAEEGAIHPEVRRDSGRSEESSSGTSSGETPSQDDGNLDDKRNDEGNPNCSGVQNSGEDSEKRNTEMENDEEKSSNQGSHSESNVSEDDKNGDSNSPKFEYQQNLELQSQAKADTAQIEEKPEHQQKKKEKKENEKVDQPEQLQSVDGEEEPKNNDNPNLDENGNPLPKKRGRPRGSTNKPKPETAQNETGENEIEAVKRKSTTSALSAQSSVTNADNPATKPRVGRPKKKPGLAKNPIHVAMPKNCSSSRSSSMPPDGQGANGEIPGTTSWYYFEDGKKENMWMCQIAEKKKVMI